METKRKTIPDIRAHKGRAEGLVCLTAYTTPMAKIFDRHADLLLVGDSIGMVLYGMENTLGVDLDMMIRHGQAVMRGASRACVVVDMPFGTYEESPVQAYRNAARLMKESGCDAVKLEGGVAMAPTIKHLTAHNIPVMAHIGLLPQSVIKEGGYKIKGRTAESEAQIMADARAIEEAGAFAVVIEGTVEDVSAKITKAISIPTIGIGASASCDGQVLVADDMLGLHEGHTAKFVKKFANLAPDIDKAAAVYALEVRARTFPALEHTYSRPTAVKKDVS
jgi:3-methyl-2-oxobutanoate hydroxymethyltransferase